MPNASSTDEDAYRADAVMATFKPTLDGFEEQGRNPAPKVTMAWDFVLRICIVRGNIIIPKKIISFYFIDSTRMSTLVLPMTDTFQMLLEPHHAVPRRTKQKTQMPHVIVVNGNVLEKCNALFPYGDGPLGRPLDKTRGCDEEHDRA